MSYLLDVTNVTTIEVENFPKMLELPANTVVGQLALFDSFVCAYNGSEWFILTNKEEAPKDVVFFVPKDGGIDSFKITPKSRDPLIAERYGVYFIADGTVHYDVNSFIDKDTAGDVSDGIFIWEVDENQHYKEMDDLIGYTAEGIKAFDTTKEVKLEYLNVEGNDLECDENDLHHSPYMNIDYNTNLKFLNYSDSTLPYVFSSPIKTVICKNGGVIPRFQSGSTLEELDIPNMQIPLDNESFKSNILDKCPNMEDLNINDNTGLTELKLTNQTKMKHLYCRNCGLTSLDVSSNPYFSFLQCDNNDLYDLKLPSPTSYISHIECQYNSHLSSLDVGNMPNLGYLRIDSTPISSIDLTNNNYIGDIHARHSSLLSLEASGKQYLTTVYMNDNTVLTGVDFSNNPKLKLVDLSRATALVSANITNDPKLETLYLSNTPLSSVDLTGNTFIKTLRVNFMPNLVDLDLSVLTERADLFLEGSALTSVTPPSVPFNTINLYGNNLSGAQVDEFFTALPDASGVPTPIIRLKDNFLPPVPVDGWDKCDITIATNKGYTVIYGPNVSDGN